MPFPWDERKTNKSGFIGGRLYMSDGFMNKETRSPATGITMVRSDGALHRFCVRGRAPCEKISRVLAIPSQHYQAQLSLFYWPSAPQRQSQTCKAVQTQLSAVKGQIKRRMGVEM